MANIKYGVTLYSYSNEYVNGLLSFEEILRTVKKQGYTGIEIVASQIPAGCIQIHQNLHSTDATQRLCRCRRSYLLQEHTFSFFLTP